MLCAAAQEPGQTGPTVLIKEIKPCIDFSPGRHPAARGWLLHNPLTCCRATLPSQPWLTTHQGSKQCCQEGSGHPALGADTITRPTSHCTPGSSSAGTALHKGPLPQSPLPERQEVFDYRVRPWLSHLPGPSQAALGQRHLMAARSRQWLLSSPCSKGRNTSRAPQAQAGSSPPPPSSPWAQEQQRPHSFTLLTREAQGEQK